MLELVPPPELIQKWCKAARGDHLTIILKAAEWGYKQRLIEEDQLLMQIVPPPHLESDDEVDEHGYPLKLGDFYAS
jgi:hypothetical protein